MLWICTDKETLQPVHVHKEAEDFEIKTCCQACLYHVEIRALQAIAWMDGNQLRHKETSAMTRQLNSVQAKLQTIL